MYEIIFWGACMVIGYALMFWGLTSEVDISTSMTKEKYNRYYGKEDKKWGR